MTLPASGAISFNNINVELNVPGTTQASLGQASYRTLAGVASGAISLSNFYGKSNTFAFTISSNQTDVNLRTLALAAGWPGLNKVVATIGSGVQISSTSTGTPALTVNGSFPNGVELINSGVIVGKGGTGGQGSVFDSPITNVGQPGFAGGGALLVSVACSITNNSVISGGGGGGGGGNVSYFEESRLSGGGGGGGNGFGAAGAAGAFTDLGTPSAGSTGGQLSGGAGGAGAGYRGTFGGAGGAGGTNAAAGSSGGAGNQGNPAPAGGAGGYAVSGNSNITWLVFGTRYGTIS